MKAYQCYKFYKFSRSGDLNIRQDLALALALAGVRLPLHLAYVSGLYYKHITIVNDDSSIISLDTHLLMPIESSFMIVSCL